MIKMANSSKNVKMSAFSVSGKFTGKVGQNNVTAAATATIESTETANGIINVPIIRTKELSKLLPTYTVALTRSLEDYLAAEDLDNIQLELEALLSSVALRYRILKNEYDCIDKDEKNNKDRKMKHSLQSSGSNGSNGNTLNGDKQPASPATSVNNTGKRKRDETGSARKLKHHGSVKQNKNSHSKSSPYAAHTDDSMDYMTGTSHSNMHGTSRENLQRLPMPKNDTPNKFWLSVEPYCMPLTNEDLRLLDDLLEQYNEPLVPPVPELGPHYSTVWATEELKEIQQASNANVSSNRLKSHNANISTGAGTAASAASNMLKKADAIVEECVTGPLTQRLVTALMEEQLLPNSNDLITDNSNSNSSNENTHALAPPPSSAACVNFRSLAMLRNCIGIEKRLKKELIEQGILDVNDFPNNEAEDEVLSEIKKLIAELSTIAEYNGNALRRLHSAATEEIKRLEVKRKLDIVDQEILECYKRTIQTKAKRKPLTNEEQQEIYRLTNKQKTLSDQLERMQANCFIYE